MVDTSSSSIFMFVPVLGKCDFPSCGNTASYLCTDCHYVEHCRECFERLMERSDIYNTFMDNADKYTCIFCFIDIQKDEVKSNNSLNGDGDYIPSLCDDSGYEDEEDSDLDR